ncbi:cell division protein ZapE [Nocardia sp. CNY236]|uniref:cell division protein ZapE n=1 Tax=Nocardia sp. CNY236 TaxID=1169152 RepID=UPI0003FFF111|nr:cell division protein ZapE [Nocardia sp. CNY236]
MEIDVIEWDSDQMQAVARMRGLLDRRGRPRRRRRGLYLYGRPGRGKTMLLDHFFTAVNSERKQRYHFHNFFVELHATARAFGSLGAAVNGLLPDVRLVCFDEFHVHDIGDAMLIARLLDILFARRVLVVVTSNYPPQELLPNPLFHHKFVPTIERILAHMDVVPVDGPVDYRARIAGGGFHTGFADGCYVVEPGCGGPHRAAVTPAASAGCAEQSVAPRWASEPAVEIPIGGRTVRAIAADSATLTIDFADVCAVRTSAADYVQLARQFPRWELRGVPPLGAAPPDQVMRLVNLIDVLYDAGCELTMIASVALGDLVRGVRGVPDLERMTSRLGQLPRSEPEAAE